MNEPPAFTGLVIHQDRQFGFVVLVPAGWQRLELSGSPGVFYAPDADDRLTGLAIEARDLETQVGGDDLAALRRGLIEGLRSLPGCRIEQREAAVVGDLLTLEAKATFADGAAVRKRWVRLLYQGRTQVRVVAQAASVALFQYWEPMFFEAIRTVRFGDAY